MGHNINLKYVTIPDSVTKIGNGCFEYCQYLLNVSIPISVTEIGARAFNPCFRLKEIEIPNSVIQIGEWCFELDIEKIIVSRYNKERISSFLEKPYQDKLTIR